METKNKTTLSDIQLLSIRGSGGTLPSKITTEGSPVDTPGSRADLPAPVSVGKLYG